MAIIPLTIDTIFDGMNQSEIFSPKSGYGRSIAIDPDMPVTDSKHLPSGLIRPTSTEKFSATTITAAPLWIITTPKTSLGYVYDNSGKVYTVDSSYAVTALNSSAALTSASGNGAEYYDNYLYLAKNTDICRYGPLNATPGFTESYWATTLSLTALTNQTYPTIRGISIPNHVMKRHVDDKLYFCDVTSTGKGIISYIKTSYSSVEGDTSSSPSYNALDLDYGYWPTTIETYGNDLAVAGMEGTSTSIKQKTAFLTFWDTTSTSYTKIIQVEYPDPLITAMKNVNGVLFVWSGSAQGGCRHTRFIGGYSFEELWYDPESYPPLQGAVDAEMNRVVWGGVTVTPTASASVFARGSKSANLGNGVHNILKSTSTGTNGSVTALKYFKQDGFALSQPIIGWKDDAGQGLDRRSTTYGTSVFRSQVYRIGQGFQMKKIRIPFAQALTAGQTLTVTCYTDSGTKSEIQRVINSTNYPEFGRNHVELFPTLNGEHDCFIELAFSGISLLTISLPLKVELETKQT
jgi:hypothetical protein